MLLLYFGSRTRENKSYGTVAKFFLNICGTAWFQQKQEVSHTCASVLVPVTVDALCQMLRLWPYSSIFSDTPHSSHSACSKHESCVQSAGCGTLGQCSQEATSTGEHAGVLCCHSQGLWDVQQIGSDSRCLKGSRSLFVIYLFIDQSKYCLSCLQLVTLSLAGRQVCAGTSCSKLVLYSLRAELLLDVVILPN